MSQAEQPSPSPSLFWDFVTSYQRSTAIRAAIDLELFTAIGEDCVTADEIAVRCGASVRGVRILSDYLVSAGFLEKSANEYSLTPDSARFLDRRSAAYLGGIVGFLQHETQRRNFWELTDAVRNGTIPADRPDSLGAEHPIWVEFARSMPAMMAPTADFLAEVALRDAGDAPAVLDIAAGHGLFGIAVAKRSPGARVTALDWPAVLDVAKQNAETAGVGDRYRPMTGSAFEQEFGGPYDLVLLTNFLHHFDREACVALMRKVRAALRPGGRAVTLEFIPNEDRVTPVHAAQFSLTMLASTPAGDAYTFQEYDDMFRAAGFEANELVEPPFGPQRLVLSRR